MLILELILYLQLFKLITITSVSCICQYHNPTINQIFTGIEIDSSPHGSRSKRSLESSFRIHFEYMDSFESYTKSSKIKRDIMEPSRIAIETVLRAKNPTNGILRIPRHCKDNKIRKTPNGEIGCSSSCDITKCLSITVPDKFLKTCKIVSESGIIYDSGNDGDGAVDTDLILLVSVEQCVGDTYAHAASCFSEQQLDRPILGIINLCHGVLHNDINVRESINIVKHEIIHTLGFAIDKFAFFRNSDGSPIVPRNSYGLPNLGISSDEGYYLWNSKITKKVTRIRYSQNGSYKKTFEAFVMPNVVEVAREHFNCPSIEAVDLEDFGGPGSALNHFDEYFLYNEIMTAESNKGLDTLSKFTLALLKDSGWYEVDFSRAEYFSYGKSTGCILPNEGCYRYMEHRRYKGKSLDPFCDRIYPKLNIARCSHRREYYDFCKLSYYNSIMKEYQYFRKLVNVPDNDVKYYMGDSEYNEFCPTKRIFSDPSSICNDENNNGRPDKNNVIQSYFGPDSLCFENGYTKENGKRFYGASCQRYKINKEKTILIIYYGSQEIFCPSSKVYYLLLNNDGNITVECPSNLFLFPLLNKSNRLYHLKIFSIASMIYQTFLN